jgi:hypothetical protein
MKTLELENNLTATSTRPDALASGVRLSPLYDRLPVDDGAPVPGQMYLANESRFHSAFFSEPLTTYAVGWRDPHKIEDLLDFVAPPLQVGRRFEFKRCDNSEAFLSESDDARALGAEFKRVEYRGSSVVEKTHNRGLTIRVDLDTVDQVPGWRESYLSRLLQRLLRNELRRSVTALSDAATAAAKIWDGSPGKDPDADILNEMIAAADQSGLRPNRILFGDMAWNKRLLTHRAQTSASGYASSGLTPEELAGFLGVDGIRISRERFQASASAKSRVTPDLVLLFNGLDDVTVDDPTHAKRFWSATESGGKFRVYEHQVSAKHVDLTVEHYSNTVITSTAGLRKITLS